MLDIDDDKDGSTLGCFQALWRDGNDISMASLYSADLLCLVQFPTDGNGWWISWPVISLSADLQYPAGTTVYVRAITTTARTVYCSLGANRVRKDLHMDTEMV
ncbi:GL26521 [Drosophila persimilis]|uniref:GL26521 n=1 Tax=Drosophila persimilis TaxID=7234 RepID=B4GSE0_DROPE|nr:GL26521 [Drosophila persimilis]